MKNIGFFWMFLMGIAIPVRSQITVTNAVFPVVGDTLFYAVDNQPGQINVLTPPGGNQQWDFSDLQPSLIWEQVFEDPRTGVSQASFPEATLLYKTADGNGEAYLKASDREVSFLGFFGGDPIGIGLDLVSQFNPPVVQRRAPVNFFDIKQVSSGLLLPFSADDLPDAIAGQLPVSPDSLRIRIAINRLDVVDGWGNVSIPGGAYEVLREKRTEYRETRLDAKVPPLGWLDITDVAIQSLGLSSLGVDTVVTYHYLNDQSKETIAICTIDNSGSQVLSVQYKNAGLTTGIKDLRPARADLNVYPNPAGAFLHIRASSLTPGSYSLVIYNALGQELWRKTCRSTADQLKEELDIARFEKGLYWCKLSMGGALMAQARFVKH